MNTNMNIDLHVIKQSVLFNIISQISLHLMSITLGLVYPGLGVKLELNRHLGFHLTQSYMPSTMFVIVGWISFVIPSDAIPGRMVVCVTTLLTLTSMFDSVRYVYTFTNILSCTNISTFKLINIFI
jgi:hypothetical protein